MEYLRLVLSWLLASIGRSRQIAAQGLAEYAILLALIAVVVVSALTAVGQTNSRKMDQVNCKVVAAGTTNAPCP